MTLRVQGLAVARGGVPVLTDLGFTVDPGHALVLRGPNGAGKTTLLRVLAGLAPPLAGRIDLPPESAAYASHADGIKATLSVTENLRFWAALYGRPWADQVLDDFDLRTLKDRPAGTLSAGQSRRLGLARLGVIGRQVLLLDEPTVSLDAASVARFAAWLRERHLGRGGIAVIATHVPLGLDAPELDLAWFRADPAAVSHGTDAAFL
ncbi:heme ABC exporter ATP-binding protein CcmA [Rubellimicrobium arenae]|uniref:heme ABC exporter ATP-binding protein CcmA n=1 Tax=Rubellimicrobium arenae TaxID=2817372 RepID=UPI001B30A187